MNISPILPLLLSASISLAAEGGDLRFRQPPVPPQPVKLKQVEASLDCLIVSSVARAIEQAGSNVENAYHYFRAMGGIFCGMSTNGNFTPSYLIQSLPTPLVSDAYLLEVNTIIVSLYKIAYEDRTRAELKPLEWMVKVSEAFCVAIDRGITKTGKEGIIK